LPSADSIQPGLAARCSTRLQPIQAKHVGALLFSDTAARIIECFQETMHIGRLGVLTQRIGESSQERREGSQASERAISATYRHFARGTRTKAELRPDVPVDAAVWKLA
jgi:hypothetical protein